MIKCVNNRCNKNPFDDESKMVLASIDGDFACCPECLETYKRERDGFFYTGKKTFIQEIKFSEVEIII